MWLKYTQDQRRDEADSLAQSSTNRWLATTPKTWTAILVNEIVSYELARKERI